MMSKLPCIDCITLAICKQEVTFTKSLNKTRVKCSLLNEYVVKYIFKEANCQSAYDRANFLYNYLYSGE